MEIQASLDFFKKGGFTVTPACRDRLEEEIVGPVNDAVIRNRQRGESEVKIKGIEARAKSYMRLVAKRMMEEGRKRGSTSLDEQVLDEARRALGPMPLFD